MKRHDTSYSLKSQPDYQILASLSLRFISAIACLFVILLASVLVLQAVQCVILLTATLTGHSIYYILWPVTNKLQSLSPVIITVRVTNSSIGTSMDVILFPSNTVDLSDDNEARRHGTGIWTRNVTYYGGDDETSISMGDIPFDAVDEAFAENKGYASTGDSASETSSLYITASDSDNEVSDTDSTSASDMSYTPSYGGDHIIILDATTHTAGSETRAPGLFEKLAHEPSTSSILDVLLPTVLTLSQCHQMFL